MLPLQAGPLGQLSQMVVELSSQRLKPLLRGRPCIVHHAAHMLHPWKTRICSVVQPRGNSGDQQCNMRCDVLMCGLDIWAHQVTHSTRIRRNPVADDGAIMRACLRTHILHVCHQLRTQMCMLGLLQVDIRPQQGANQDEQHVGEEQAAQGVWCVWLVRGCGGAGGRACCTSRRSCGCTDVCGFGCISGGSALCR